MRSVRGGQSKAGLPARAVKQQTNEHTHTITQASKQKSTRTQQKASICRTNNGDGALLVHGIGVGDLDLTARQLPNLGDGRAALADHAAHELVGHPEYELQATRTTRASTSTGMVACSR